MGRKKPSGSQNVDKPDTPTKGQPPDPRPTPEEVDKSGQAAERGDGHAFPIVGIGASAGGIEAQTQLLRALPANTGMAFVLVQHLDPSHESMLADILSRATSMPVMEVQDE